MVQKGRPPVDSIGIMLRLHNDIVKKIDDIRREEDDLPSRQEMIRRMLADWIEENENMK
jgi:metal-responsive CopG/Arc/MetJ family transcriptional regulator